MRKLLLLTLLMPLFVMAQKDIPKKSDRIIISNTKSAADNFIHVKRILADQNIEIASQDKDVFQIKSGVVKSKKGGVKYYVINCKDNAVVLSGMFKSGYEINLGGVTATDDFEIIVNKGMNGSAYKNAFNDMNEFAKTIGTETYYEISK